MTREKFMTVEGGTLLMGGYDGDWGREDEGEERQKSN